MYVLFFTFLLCFIASYVVLRTHVWQYVFFFMCLLVGVSACKQGGFTDNTDTEKTAYVTVVRARNVEIANPRVAEIMAVNNVEIRNRTPGYLMGVHVDEGEHVKAGQLMFTFNSDEVSATLNKEMANLKSTEAEEKVARLEVARLEGLVDKDIISPLQLEIARAKHGALEAKVSSIRETVALAELQVSYMQIKAPFNGVVNRIPYKAGSFLPAGVLLTSISDISKVHAYFYVPETEYLQLFERSAAKHHRPFDTTVRVGLILSDGTRYKYTGVIQTMGGEFEDNTGTIVVRVLFPNPSGILKHHASAKVVLPVRLNDVLMIPTRSVLDIQTKKYVYVLQKDRGVTMIPFNYTYRYEDYFVVPENGGIKAGDTIIYEGLQHIKADTKVLPIVLSADSLWNLNLTQ